jgi:hypothetical protein
MDEKKCRRRMEISQIGDSVYKFLVGFLALYWLQNCLTIPIFV